MVKSITHTFSIPKRYEVVCDVLAEWRERGYNLSAKICELIESDYNHGVDIKMPGGKVLKAIPCDKCREGYVYE